MRTRKRTLLLLLILGHVGLHRNCVSEAAKHDKNRIAAEVDGPFGEHVRFLGFDAHSQNSESGLLHIAEFIVEKLGSFKSTFGGRDLDSHIPMADKYRRMIRVFEPIRRTLIGTMLSTDQLIKVLNAAKGEAGAE